MSKIVILKINLAASVILSDILDRVKINRPEVAEWIEDLDALSLIKECVNNTLNYMAEEYSGVRIDSDVLDYGGSSFKTYEGKSLIGSLKTENLPKGLGVFLNADGSIGFLADDYTDNWKKEIARVQGEFKKVFIAEAHRMILEIFEYEVSVEKILIDDPETNEEKYNLYVDCEQEGVLA